MRHQLLAVALAGALAAPCLARTSHAALVTEDILATPYPNNGRASFVQMVLDRDRRPHLVVDVFGPSIYYLTRGTTGGWSVSTVDSMGTPGRTGCGSESGFGTFCAIALDAEGTALVTYYDACIYSYGRRILCKQKEVAGSWSLPAQVVAHDVYPNGPMSLAVDATGDAHLAYPMTNACSYVHRQSGVWAAPEQVARASYAAPSLTLDPSGAPLIAFNQGNTVLLAARSSGTWSSSPVATASPTGQVGTFPSIAGTTAGDVRVALASGGSMACALRDAGVWTVEYAAAVGGDAARIAVGPGGALWVLHINRANRLMLSCRINGSWQSTVVSDDPVSRDLNSHWLAVDDVGRAHIVYQVDTGPGGNLVLRYGVDVPGATSVGDVGVTHTAALSISVRPEVLRSGDELAVHVLGSQARAGSAMVMDAAGRCVARRRLALSEGETEFRWRLPVFRAGTYFLLVASGDRAGSQKLVLLP